MYNLYSITTGEKLTPDVTKEDIINVVQKYIVNLTNEPISYDIAMKILKVSGIDIVDLDTEFGKHKKQKYSKKELNNLNCISHCIS